jgi:hypothetical protein
MMKYSMNPLILVGLLLVSISSTARANDDCSEAVAVTTVPFSTTGDLTRATADFTVPTDTFRNLTCGISTEALGIWYRISVPDVPAFLQATVTDAPGTSTMINVALFEGTSCDEMECKTDREYQLENQRTEPKLTWFAKEGVSYFLHVAGMNANQVGEFTLNVEVSIIHHVVVPWRTGQLLDLTNCLPIHRFLICSNSPQELLPTMTVAMLLNHWKWGRRQPQRTPLETGLMD